MTGKKYIQLVIIGDGDHLMLSCGSKFMLMHNYSLKYVDAECSHNGATLDIKAKGTKANISMNHPEEMQLLSRVTPLELLNLVREYLKEKDKYATEMQKAIEPPEDTTLNDQSAIGPAPVPSEEDRQAG